MNRSLSTSTAIFLAIAISALVSACDGGGPRCEPVVTPTTCDPVCDFAAGEFCNEDTDECVARVDCDPACDTATQFCNFLNGTCEDLPATCDPACDTATEFCDDGTCRAIPDCEPDCEAGEVCVE